MDEVRAFQATVALYLRQHDIALLEPSPAPHLMISYRGGVPADRPIDPISWTVEEFLLIESLHEHVTHGRWPLRSKLD